MNCGILADELKTKDGTADKLTIEVPDYSLIYLDEGDSVVDGSATVTLYDMYRNTAGVGLRVIAQIDGEPASPVENHGMRVNSRGLAKFSRKGIDSASNPRSKWTSPLSFERGQFSTNMLGNGIPDVTTNPTIPVVGTPTGDQPALDAGVSAVLADEDKFESELQADVDDAAVTAGIDVVVYNDDGSSIFRIDPQ